MNFDSVQVYRGLDVGSAKTPVELRRGIPHHLVDVAEPEEDFTAGTFARTAQTILKEITERGRIPVLVGGTGFYLRSLLEGLSPAPARNIDLRQRLSDVAARRPGALQRFLRRLDKAAAVRIHTNDLQKLIRAIELACTVSSPSPRAALVGFEVTKIGLNPPRSELYERLNARSAAMFDAGLLEETRRLLESGVPANAKTLQSLGYKQAVAVLEGQQTLEEAVVELQTRTRQYAKRQMTWFRKEAGVVWMDGFGDEARIQESAKRVILERIEVRSGY